VCVDKEKKKGEETRAENRTTAMCRGTGMTKDMTPTRGERKPQSNLSCLGDKKDDAHVNEESNHVARVL